MERSKGLSSRTLVVARDNVDTDQIIPARFLKVTERRGLGRGAFADWRYDKDGNVRPDSIFDGPAAKGAAILVAGDNFGCGSSREHAPWALYDFGIRAVVSSSIADIFRNNATKNGIIPVVVDPETHRFLLASPGVECSIDLEHRTLTAGGRSAVFPLDPFARYCLMNGVDELQFILDQAPAIQAFEEARG